MSLFFEGDTLDANTGPLRSDKSSRLTFGFGASFGGGHREQAAFLSQRLRDRIPAFERAGARLIAACDIAPICPSYPARPCIAASALPPPSSLKSVFSNGPWTLKEILQLRMWPSECIFGTASS
jgi:hypothetical protein